MKNKVVFVSIANAIAIIAVIIGHLDITGCNNDPNTPVANIIGAFGSFQMPLFMCISGYLFTMTSGFNKPYYVLINSKVKRLIVPFLFLSVFTFFFKMCLPSSMLEHGVGFNEAYLIKMLFIPFRGPVPHLWFVVSLFTIFLLSPLLKWTLKNHVCTVVAIVLLYTLHCVPPVSSILGNKELLALDKTQYFIIWFFLGMLLRKYSLMESIHNWRSVLISGMVYVAFVYFIQFPFSEGICMLAGITLILSLSQMLAEKCEWLFASWRNYTYQIYLLHMFPIMGGGRYLYKTHMFENEIIWFACCWIIGLSLAIILPTMVAKITEKLPSKIRILIGL